MINTHYFRRPPILDAATFAAFAADVRKIFDAAPLDIVLRGQDGTGHPVVDSRSVMSNGAKDFDHEPLIIEQTYTLQPPDRMRDGMFADFCKTHGKPYDLIVVAVLNALIRRFPGCTFASDSSPDELQPGYEFFLRVVQPTLQY